jgi:predicted 3-demethylubiquinone-9 3-methyltransferase (glyoxalase superfamily)
MQKIIPHLWFDKEAKEASEFYVQAFNAIGQNSKIVSSSVIHDTPSGDADILTFNLGEYSFMAISAGPYFKLNPSISFMLNFDPSQDEKAEEHLNLLWEKLSLGGEALMPLNEYPFSKRYGWVKDKYGVTWQLILTNPEGEERPFIIPSLMFANDIFGKAEEATDFYISVFKNAKRGQISHYTAGMEPNKEGTVMFTDFMLEGQWFAAMDAPGAHDFIFNEAISLLVQCDSQEEIDYYWEKLSFVPESEQCGWLKDKYGVSWQISPREMEDMMKNGTPLQVERVTKAFLAMKKFDLAKLRDAYEGR